MPSSRTEVDENSDQPTIENGERRHEERERLVRCPAKITTPHAAGLCLVRNISSQGMKADIYGALDDGQPVEIEFSSGLVAQAEVIWTLAQTAGFRFCERIALQDVLAREHDGRRARSPRVSVASPARIESEHGSAFGKLVDISLGGAKVATSLFVHPGEYVTVEVQGLPVMSGSIRWMDFERMGAQFSHPLPLPSLGSWLSAQAA